MGQHSNSQYSCAKSVNIKVDNNTLKLAQGKNVLYNGQEVNKLSTEFQSGIELKIISSMWIEGTVSLYQCKIHFSIFI